MLVRGLTATSAGVLPTWTVVVTLIGAVNSATGLPAGDVVPAAAAAGARGIADAASTMSACRVILMLQPPRRRFTTPGSSRDPRTPSKSPSHRARPVEEHPIGDLTRDEALDNITFHWFTN